MTILTMPTRTFRARLFETPFESTSFKVAGTLDGCIDLAVPNGGTYPLSLDEAHALVEALNGSITDVETNCLYERDSLAQEEKGTI